MRFLSRFMAAISRPPIGSQADDCHRIEVLEARQLLSGVTVITHGFTGTSYTAPGWLYSMASAVVGRAGPDTAVYDLVLKYNSSGQGYVHSFARLSGPSPTSSASSNDETVLLIDWAADSGITGTLDPTFSTKSLATLIIPYLTKAWPTEGIDLPLAEGPIQFIGHSRGGSLVSEIAKDLGQSGIWVDQLTTLDPHPVSSVEDPDVSVGSNVVFADNYYQTSGSLSDLFTTGSFVPGAYNLDVTKFDPSHEGVHAYYEGTIDLTETADGDGFPISPSWYCSPTRSATGYVYSRIGGGTRPSVGLSHYFGGPVNDGRMAVSLTTTAWPNIAGLSTGGQTSFPQGQSIPVSFMYSNYANAANVQFYLDTDQNPYNGAANSTPDGTLALTSLHFVPTAGTATVNTADIPPGTYYLDAVIKDTNTNSQRIAYLPGQITVLPAAPDGVAATYGTNSQAVQITWEASAGATGYGVWRSLSSDGTAATQINTADITGLAYNDTTAAAGTVYWYWVWAHDGSGSGTFSSAVQERPANDDFAARATLSGTSVTLTGMNLNATKESGEPDHAGRVGGTSVWWTWTAPFSGDVTIDTIGSNFNTLLAVYTGNSVSALTAVPNGADDDIPGGQPGGPSKVTFGVTGGTVYQIAVDGYQGATGNFTLNLNLLPSAPGGVAATYGTNSGEVRVTWNASAGASGYDVWRDSSSTFSTATSLATGIQGLSFDDTTAVAGIPYWYKVNACDNNGSGTLSSAVPDRPANDNFAARATLSGTSITLTGMNLNATQESGEPDHAGQAGGSSVWWTWTAPFSGSATIDTLGSNFNTLLAVYTGSNVRTLAGVAGGADDDVAGRSDGTSKVTFTANGGTVYQIAVDGYNGATGTIALSLQLIPLGPDGVAATYGTGSGGVRLTWNASAGASSYDVWRDSISDNGNSKIQIAADVQGPNFDDATAVAGVPYWYWIRARDANGSGGFSAGVQLTGSITATVFNDANGDGIRQSTEKPLANITVYIDANNNGSFDAGERTARTNKTGVYLFSNVPIGSYVVRPVLPAGYRPATNLNTPLPTLLPGQALGRNIGLTTNALVSGTVFLDTNKNGKMDTTEVGLARYRVFIDNDNDGVWDANETSVLTNATGAFSFPTLAAGSYVLRVVPAKGYKVATPATKLYSLSLKAGQTVSARNFAVVKA